MSWALDGYNRKVQIPIGLSLDGCTCVGGELGEVFGLVAPVSGCSDNAVGCRMFFLYSRFLCKYASFCSSLINEYRSLRRRRLLSVEEESLSWFDAIQGFPSEPNFSAHFCKVDYWHTVYHAKLQG